MQETNKRFFEKIEENKCSTKGGHQEIIINKQEKPYQKLEKQFQEKPTWNFNDYFIE